MGITAILGAALKNLPWRTIAIVAMERAPELFQKTKERFKQSGEPPGEAAIETELQEKIAHLQRLLIDQRSLNREQAEKSAAFEKRCAALEIRLFSFKVVSGVLFIAVMLLLALLFR